MVTSTIYFAQYITNTTPGMSVYVYDKYRRKVIYINKKFDFYQKFNSISEWFECYFPHLAIANIFSGVHLQFCLGTVNM